jgi:acetylornithine deacetylase/succinyl-diaminopimelate desuccinylase-like protein
MLDAARLGRFVEAGWGDEIVPTLVDYIRIPNKSPAFDPDWAAHGYMEDAVRMFAGWARSKLAAFPGASLEIVRVDGRTPLILIDIPGTGEDCVLLYGHLDKQPEMVGWAEGYGPWSPRLDGDRLYGRGGADDGYAMFAALTALAALRDQRVPHARAVVLIEACEESGSYDLPYYVDHLADRIGRPSLVVCLDSGCGNYDQLWLTTSLRGIAAGTLRVEVLGEGVHSGYASGIVPSSFRILRQLLSRLEDESTGAVRPAALYAQIPAERVEQAKRAAAALGDGVWREIPFAGGTRPMAEDLTELLLNRSWRPQLAVTGIDGLPKPGDAGNVLLPYTEAKLSLRLPPTLDAADATRLLQTRPMARRSALRRRPIRPAGMRRPWPAGSRNRWSAPRRRRLAARRHFSAKAAASPLWRCSARNFPTRSLS